MRIRNIPKNTLKLIIRLYGYVVSPWLGTNKCRFYPTCSHYAHDAVDRHGVTKGVFLTIRRVLKCHPWYKGAIIDDVPSSIDWKDILRYNSASKDKDTPD